MDNTKLANLNPVDSRITMGVSAERRIARVLGNIYDDLILDGKSQEKALLEIQNQLQLILKLGEPGLKQFIIASRTRISIAPEQTEN
jgi:hypothetical protein